MLPFSLPGNIQDILRKYELSHSGWNIVELLERAIATNPQSKDHAILVSDESWYIGL